MNTAAQQCCYPYSKLSTTFKMCNRNIFGLILFSFVFQRSSVGALTYPTFCRLKRQSILLAVCSHNVFFSQHSVLVTIARFQSLRLEQSRSHNETSMPTYATNCFANLIRIHVFEFRFFDVYRDNNIISRFNTFSYFCRTLNSR